MRGAAEVGERVLVVGVDAELGADEVRCESFEEGDDRLSECPNVDVVAGVWREGEVHGEAFTFSRPYLGDGTGGREEIAAALVHRDGQDIPPAVEGLLNAVAVMGVDVDVGDLHAVAAAIQEMGDGDGGVVEDTESGGPVPVGVVQSARRVEGDARFLVDDEIGRVDGGPDDEGGGLVHAADDGIVDGAKAEFVGPPQETALTGGADGGDVVLAVDEGDGVLVCGRRRGERGGWGIQQPAGLDELIGAQHSSGPERMGRAQIVVAELGRVNEGCLWHDSGTRSSGDGPLLLRGREAPRCS